MFREGSCFGLIWCTRREMFVRTRQKVLGGMALAFVRLVCKMEWTVSEAGVNLGEVERRVGSGFEES